jgi:hypothetical protein
LPFIILQLTHTHVFVAETLTKLQVVTIAPKVSEIEDVLANELSFVVQTLTTDKKLTFTPVSRNDLKYLSPSASLSSSLSHTTLILVRFNIVGGPRYQKYPILFRSP